MPWFRVDDGLSSNKKVLRIRRSQRCAAIGLWTLAGAWSSHELTDGFIPTYMLEELGGSEKLAGLLVDVAGVWTRVQDGFVFNNWNEFQPTRAAVEKRREDEAARKAEWRAKRQNVRNVSQRDIGGTDTGTGTSVRDLSALPDPTRPDPVPSPTEKERGAAKRGTRLPRDWRPSSDLMLELRQQRTDLDLDQVLQDFSDYWHAKAGKDAVKVDWSLTFRSWVRKEHVGLHNAARSDATDPLAGWSAPPPDDDTIAAGTRAIAEHYRRAREAELTRRQQGAA